MDAKKFGTFIAQVRKEKGMTQAELAEKLNITDKAVSKWERGLGFPDINLIEPLAGALEVSILEIMRSQKADGTTVAQEDAAAALRDTIEIVKLQRKTERKTVFKIGICIIAAMALLFLLDSTEPIGVILALLPVICLVGGFALLIYGFWRRKHRLPCLQSFVAAVVMLAVPLCVLLFFIIAGALGLGPVPNCTKRKLTLESLRGSVDF